MRNSQLFHELIVSESYTKDMAQMGQDNLDKMNQFMTNSGGNMMTNGNGIMGSNGKLVLKEESI